MDFVFRPVRRRGLILFLGIFILNLALLGWLVLQALAQQTRGFFILYLIAAVAAFIPVPVVLYRLFSLLRAKYVIDREGLHIQWGLRTEDIPMDQIEWIRSTNDLPFEVNWPAASIPGAVLGTRVHRDLGPIEFIASDRRALLYVAARDRIFAISPANQAEFISVFQRSAELGSISPIERKSSSADFLISSLFSDKAARTFILTGLFFSLGLLVLTSFIIPTRKTVPLGFMPGTQNPEPSPSERLLLLPVLSLFTLMLDIGLGAYLFRKQGFRIASYFAFASSIIAPLSFLVLVALIILFPV